MKLLGLTVGTLCALALATGNIAFAIAAALPALILTDLIARPPADDELAEYRFPGAER